jgi:hypothetical protein
MNKIDLIIEAIRLAEYHVKARGWGDDIDLELYTEALAAARELKALKPVAWQNLHLPDEFYDAELLDPSWYSHYRPLYALDEVTK